MYAFYPFHTCWTMLLVALPHVFSEALIFSLIEANAPPFAKGGLSTAPLLAEDQR
jgi:hypothetical protein